jgi:membrane protein implicated in regulation of membrane protease activity
MDTESKSRTRAENLDEVWKWTVGGGILLMALAPLALPILILTLVAVLPLAVPLFAIGVLAAAVAVPAMLVRKLGRSVGRTRPRRHGRAPAASTKPATDH